MATAAAALSCAAAARQAPEPVRTVFRIFSGTDEVTAATRVRVRVSGTTEEEGGIVLNGPALAAELAPGIYDAQAIHHRRGRVLNVRWAERLVIVRYPDEGEEHLEVINFLPNFGALQLRLPPRTRADPAIVTIQGQDGAGADRARVYPGSDYLLVVAPAGTYTVTLSLPTGPATLPPVEIPADRTRMRVLGGAETP
jgi:hypothetical protein